MAVVHEFVSAKSDGADDTLVRPSNWNADHRLTGVSRHSITVIGTTGYTIEHNLNSTWSYLIGWSTTWSTTLFVNRAGTTSMDVSFTSPSATPSDIFISHVETVL